MTVGCRLIIVIGLCLICGGTGAVAQQDPFFPIVENGKWGLIAVVPSGNRWGHIDTQGTFVIPAQFDRAVPFKDGLAFVERIDRGRFTRQVSYIDVKGRTVYTMRFTGVG